MPRHDLRCVECGFIDRDRNLSMEVLDRLWHPLTPTSPSPLPACPVCEADVDKLIPLEIYHVRSAHQLLGEEFIIDVHDGHTHYQGRVSSLSELRHIERESERHAANEPGCTPLVFRDFSQGKSNRTQNSLAGTSWERGRAKRRESGSTHAGRISARAVPERD